MRQVVVLSDAGSTAPPSWPAKRTSALISFGRKAGNVGITRLQARRSLLDPIGYEILAEVSTRRMSPRRSGSSWTWMTTRSTSCR